MQRFISALARFFTQGTARWLLVPVAALAAASAVIGVGTPPSYPAVALSSEPLYARGVRSKPTLTLALSVEFPTVGQAYPATDAYDTAKEYVGYFDATSCYTYSHANKRFDRSGAATSRACGGTAFSGNFMNWAATSAIDILRFSLTGGDRITETDSTTVLQRAVIPNNFYNSSNFSSRSVSNTLAQGALPAAVLGSHAGTVYIANCLNRVFFGTAATGTCDSPGNNSNLGANYATGGAVTAPRPTGFTWCANENGVCVFVGTKQVIYGADTRAGGGVGAYATLTATTTINCNNTTFGDPLSGTAKSCYYRDVPAATAVPANLTSDTYYTAAVQVCESSAGVLTDPRSSYCQRYPSGYYKPVGNLQQYSDSIRVAAFGYLMDNTTQRYGGVLRAPMKYVGDKAYDGNFNLIAGNNPVQEWDPTSGRFKDNPDSAAEGVSGVTNYLNRFGRSGSYKTYDPVGELYYEALRYIQGLPPTTAATSGMTTAMKDSFPVYDTWTDPHPAITGLTNYSCINNNILTIGDVNTHFDKQLPGNTTRYDNSADYARSANLAGNEPNFYDWTRVVGAFESNHTEVTYVDGKGVTRSVSNPNTANTARWGMETQTVSDNASYFMAGAAYWANTHDIRGTDWTANVAKQRPGMRAKTYIVDVNEYGDQTNVTTRRNNQFYLSAKYGGFKDVSEKGNPFYDASGTADNSIWQQSNPDRDAKTYFLAGNPKDLITALGTIFKNIAEEANSIAGGAITTQTVTSSNGKIFQASFNPDGWSGDVLSYGLSLNTDGTLAVGASDTAVKASTKLKLKAASARNIVVGKTVPTVDLAGSNFLWGEIDSTQQAALRLPPGGVAGTTPLDAASAADAAASSPTATSGEGRLNWLRGDQSKETSVGGPYRARRSSVLGDVVSSGVVFAGEPSARIVGAGYASFYGTNKSRTQAVYVGANDGMLHAFNASTMDELFAYIPNFVVAKLPDLTASAYVHRSYVDATPVIGEAQLDTTNTASWKTVLVGGAGGGGQGVYALDVTNPSAFGASSVLWEFTDKNDPDLGNVVGKPQIMKVRVSKNGESLKYKWFAVVASGVNNHVDDGAFSATGAGNGYPALFFLELGKAKNVAWSLGTNYFKIRFPQAVASKHSGMISFAATGGSADELAQLYAGDLQGNMWKLDFSVDAVANSKLSTPQPVNATAVEVGSLLPGTGVQNASASPLFIAKNGAAATDVQPISMEPSLLYGPNRSTIVAFGTGKYLETSDNVGPFQAQSVYAVLDNNLVSIPGRARLNLATQNGTSGALTAGSFVWGVPASDTDLTVRAGWYFDFAGSTGSGERQISSFALFGKDLIFGSVIPTQNGCDGGSGKQYTVTQNGGVGTSVASTVGIMGQPFVLQTGAATLTVSDSTGSRIKTTKAQTVVLGSGGLKSTPELLTATDRVGRLTWRQINNYQDVKNAVAP